MQYNVAQLLKEPIGSMRSYQVEETLAGPLRITDRVAGPVHMVRTHQGILVNADLDVESVLACSRCLGEFARPSTLHIEEEYFSMADVKSGKKLDLSPDDDEVSLIDEDHVLDLSEMMRQYAISDLPLKPLCRTDCKGLCRVCGANLNKVNCGCATGQIDPRWGALAGLLHPEKG